MATLLLLFFWIFLLAKQLWTVLINEAYILKTEKLNCHFIIQEKISNIYSWCFVKKASCSKTLSKTIHFVVSIEFFPLLMLNSTMETTDKILCET